MSNTYTWVIESLHCLPLLEGKTNVVFSAHWRVNATDGVNIATVYGSQVLNYIKETPFTEYADLTLATVLDWVQTAMGVSQIDAIKIELDKQIANLINPPVISPALPWQTV